MAQRRDTYAVTVPTAETVDLVTCSATAAELRTENVRVAAVPPSPARPLTSDDRIRTPRMALSDGAAPKSASFSHPARAPHQYEGVSFSLRAAALPPVSAAAPISADHAAEVVFIRAARRFPAVKVEFRRGDRKGKSKSRKKRRGGADRAPHLPMSPRESVSISET